MTSREEGTTKAQPTAERIAGGQTEDTMRHIVFFDVETNVPGRMCRNYELLEFGAVVLDVRGLAELRSFHTLLRPKDLSCIDQRTSDCNTITSATVAGAPSFAEVADDIYKLLHGHIWAGHNVLKFDILRVNEAFLKIGQPPPQPFGVIDTYPLLRKTFGKRAGNYKLATLANYCGFGKQEHRSIADVRMNIDVLRSCATMLFLESNYPDILSTQMDVTACASVSEQSGRFSTPCKSTIDDNAEQEVDSQLGLSDQVANPSSVSKPPPFHSRSQLSSEMNTSPLLAEITESLKATTLSESGDAQASTLASARKESIRITLSRDVGADEECTSSQLFKVSSCVAQTKHIQEYALTGYEQIIEKVSVAEVMDAKATHAESLPKPVHKDAPICYTPIESTPFVGNVEILDDREEHFLSKDLLYVSLEEELEKREVASGSNGDVLLSEAQPSDQDPRTESDGVPFFLASHVYLPTIELREEPSSFGCTKVLCYDGFPLHLLESNIRVHFTINLSYAFDDKGKPRFSILLEPSESARKVISKCEDVVKSMSALATEVEWLPALRKVSGCWTARMSIGTKWGKSFSTYTTEFFHHTSKGLEKLSLGHVDATTFRSVIPHGCLIDVGFGFSVFQISNRAGIKLVAKYISLA